MKKFFLVLLTLFYSSTLLLSSASPSRAAGVWYNPSQKEFKDKVFEPSNANEIFGERYTFAQVTWILHSIALNLDPNIKDDATIQALKDFLGSAQTTPTLADYSKFGPAGIMLGSMGEMFRTPIVSGIKELESTLAKFDIAAASPVHAQGYGFQASEGLRSMWTASRNTAYLVMIILLLASGFMIMFKIKINPQTAVTLQLMIPKIITTLILVTFSYAIAGFVIDMTFALVGFVVFAFSGTGGMIGDPSRMVGFLTGGLSNLFFYYLLYYLLWSGVGTLMLILPGLISLIMLILVLFLLARVWWMLLKTYLMFILLVIVGPWQIMLGLLPNQQGFGAWFRNIIAQASVFVVVPIMFLFSIIIGKPDQNIIVDFFHTFSGTITALVNQIFFGSITTIIPDKLPSFPLLTANGGPGANATDLKFLLSFAALSLIPKTADMIRDALKIPAFKYGSAMGEALGEVRSLGSGGVGAGSSWLRYSRNSPLAGNWADGKPATATGQIVDSILSTVQNKVKGR